MADTLTAPPPAPTAPAATPKAAAAPRATPAPKAAAAPAASAPAAAKPSIFQSIHDAKPKYLPEPAKPDVRPEPSASEEQPKAPAKVISVHDDLDGMDDDEPQKAPQETEAPAAPESKADSGSDKTTGPWKQVRNWEKKYATLEKAHNELKSISSKGADEKVTALQSRLDETTKQNEELLTELRFVNYQKHPEFKRDYDEPYDKTTAKALKDVTYMTVTDPESGVLRQATGADLYKVVNADVATARKTAKALFGEYENDVMAYRKEIISLYEKREEALKDARTKGLDREKQQLEQTTRQRDEIKKFVEETRDAEMARMNSHEKWGKFFQPVEGDDEGNGLLDKGYNLVKEAFSRNPDDPRLSQEDRAALIRKRVAVWHKAGSYNRLVRDLNKAKATIAERDKALAQFQESEPETEGQHQGVASAEGNGWSGDSFGERLAKRGKGR